MAPKRTPDGARPIALQTIISDNGCAGLLVVALATGLGLLLDFQVTQLHPFFSVGLLVLSVPVSLYWTARRILRMDRKQNPDYFRNLALAAVAGQAGCSTVILVFLALFGGLWLDARLDTHPVFTVLLVLLSIPLGLYAMVRTVLSTTARIKPSPPRAPRGDASVSSSSSASQHSPTKENGP